jgi:type III restriction enzyme
LTQQANAKLPIRDGNKEVTVRLKKQVMLSEQFMEIWDRIKQKTTYRVEIDRQTLMANCIKEMKNMQSIPKARLVTQTADIDIQDAGVTHIERGLRTAELGSDYDTLPDIVRVITTETLLKRSTVGHILKESNPLL